MGLNELARSIDSPQEARKRGLASDLCSQIEDSLGLASKSPARELERMG